MDDELDRAARKHRLNQRQGALRAQQRQRQEAQRQAEVALAPRVESCSASTSRGEASSSSAIPAAWTAPSHEEVHCGGGPFVCFICSEEKGGDERFVPHRCSAIPAAMCCKPCFVAWVESQIDNDASTIKCCHCDLTLAPSIVVRLVDSEHWASYCKVALQRTLRRDPTFIWCSKCPGGGWVDSRQPSSNCGWTCPECTNAFVYCPLCRRDHGSLSCKRFQRLRHEVFSGTKAKDRDSEGVVQRSAKTCPSCRMPIQKDGGCNFMDCPNCRRHFCWSCGRVLKGSHQKHACDAGFEGSDVVAQTPGGLPCVELTRLFTNVLDVDNIEMLNSADPEDLLDLRDMLMPGVSYEQRCPLFVGPSECDGELLVRLPFNFPKAISWEITHLIITATHPPTPTSRPPRSVGLIANAPSATFSDFEDPTTIRVPLEDHGHGKLIANLEHLRVRGTFRRVICLAAHFSGTAVGTPESLADGHEDEDVGGGSEIFFNNMALFGIPGGQGAASARRGGAMYDGRADLIVSPILGRRRWGEEAEAEDPDSLTRVPADEEEVAT